MEPRSDDSEGVRPAALRCAQGEELCGRSEAVDSFHMCSVILTYRMVLPHPAFHTEPQIFGSIVKVIRLQFKKKVTGQDLITCVGQSSSERLIVNVSGPRRSQALTHSILCNLGCEESRQRSDLETSRWNSGVHTAVLLLQCSPNSSQLLVWRYHLEQMLDQFAKLVQLCPAPFHSISGPGNLGSDALLCVAILVHWNRLFSLG